MRAIFHADREWGIGKNNGLMFSIPQDMKFFRETTKGKVVVMGLNTLLSFPNGKPLKNRVNIVLCPDDVPEDVITVHSPEELFQEVKKYPEDDVFVVGGAMLYRTLLPYCSGAIVTKADADGGAEVFFENLDALPGWVCESEGEPTETNGITIRFCVYKNTGVREFAE